MYILYTHIILYHNYIRIVATLRHTNPNTHTIAYKSKWSMSNAIMKLPKMFKSNFFGFQISSCPFLTSFSIEWDFFCPAIGRRTAVCVATVEQLFSAKVDGISKLITIKILSLHCVRHHLPSTDLRQIFFYFSKVAQPVETKNGLVRLWFVSVSDMNWAAFKLFER